jgi:uncharacterized protein (TIGR03083 family)
VSAPDAKVALLHALLDDLAAESADVDARVADLDDAAWRIPTPAAGWDVHDSISHLAATDADALLAVQGAEAFASVLERVAQHGPEFVDRVLEQGRAVPPAALLAAGGPAATRCMPRSGGSTRPPASPGSGRR